MATLLRADSLRNAGSYAEAIEAYREVNDKKGIPGSWRLRALTGMATCNKQTGNYREALENYRTIDSEGLLDVRGKLNMSNLYLTLGLYADAVDLLEPLNATIGQDTRLINLASAYAYLGRGSDALQLLATAPTDGMSAEQKATLTANRGFIEMSLGQHEAAAASLGKATGMLAEGAGRYIVMANLALAESGCGHADKALAHIDSCLTWQKTNLGEKHPDYAISVRKRAEILLKAGRKTEAAAWFKTYFGLMRNYVCRSFAFLTDKQRQDFWFSNEPLVTECYATEAADPQLLYDVALFSKCLLLQVERNIEAEARRDTSASRLYDSIASLRREADKGSSDARQRDSLYAEADRQEQRLMAMMDGYRSFNANMRLTSADIARRLGRNETAIEFIRYGSTSARRYVALTLDGTGKVGFVPLWTEDSLREDDTMSRSGLVFAGANRMVQPAYSAYDDGILLAREASEMRLDRAALVVLSACQTGLGPITSEGVFGFQRGLKKAGAGAIVASLWNVDDKATKLLMTRFYHHLLGGMPMSEAFAQAKTDLRCHEVKIEVETDEDDKSHGQIRRLGRWVWPKKKVMKTVHPYSKPQYWAAFILIKK